MSRRKVAVLALMVFSSCATAGGASAPVLLAEQPGVPMLPSAAAEPSAPAARAVVQPLAANAEPVPKEVCEAGPPEACQSAVAEVAAPLMAASVSAIATRTEASEDARYVDVVSEQGQRAHGLYFTAMTMRRLGAKGIIHSVRSAGLDAAVIDLKDQDGRVNYATRVASLADERQLIVHDMPGLVHELKSAGIYVIGRIVCFSDPVLPRKHPELAVMDARPNRASEIWNQRRTNTWLDPYNTKNHDMLIELAVEAESLGFDEVQLDYIRFPVDAGTVFARFPSQGDAPRYQVLLGMLRRLDAALHIPLGVDVFGVAAIRRGDPEGLGQSLDDWAQYVEVFTPMLYVNGMKPWMRNKTEGRAGLLVEVSVHALRKRVGPAPVIRPFLQAFDRGADYFNTKFIAEQIRGARMGGGDGFLFWNPTSSYGIVRTHMLSSGRAELSVPFENRPRAAFVLGPSLRGTRVPLVRALRARSLSDDSRKEPWEGQ
jgi:hypothetical protein